MKSLLSLCILVFALISMPVIAQDGVVKTWNKNSFSSNKTFSENIQSAPEFSILASLLEDEYLANALKSNGMVTVFAMTDSSFGTWEKSKRDSVMSNMPLKRAMVKYHTVQGRIDKSLLQATVAKNGGSVQMTTLQKEKITVQDQNGTLILTDSQGNKATITATNFSHKNGFFHIVEGVLLPTMME